MEKIKKSTCLNATWCFLFLCLFLNALTISFLIVNGLDQNWHCINWHCIKIILLYLLLVTNIVCVILLAKHDNDRILSEKDECVIKLEQVTNEYKTFVRNELKNLSNVSPTNNYSLCKTLEMIIETFNDRDCDESRLKTLKTIIDAVNNSREAENQTISNSEKGQKKE